MLAIFGNDLLFRPIGQINRKLCDAGGLKLFYFLNMLFDRPNDAE